MNSNKTNWKLPNRQPDRQTNKPADVRRSEGNSIGVYQTGFLRKYHISFLLFAFDLWTCKAGFTQRMTSHAHMYTHARQSHKRVLFSLERLVCVAILPLFRFIISFVTKSKRLIFFLRKKQQRRKRNEIVKIKPQNIDVYTFGCLREKNYFRLIHSIGWNITQRSHHHIRHSDFSSSFPSSLLVTSVNNF